MIIESPKVVDHDMSNEKITLSIKGRSEFTAGMIGEATNSFQIMNPNLLICTMDSTAKLNIELTISKGRGYVPADENKVKDAPFGLNSDAIYLR
jgi:DNA-directed RNA polymerase subunit alpha